MDDINAFITDNFVIIIVISVIIMMTIIGYIAKKLGFGEKLASNDNSDTSDEKINNQNIETLNENVENDKDNKVVDPLDAIAPNFNTGGLVIGDVNQNPAITNKELGISDDLYAPFGDDEESKKELKIEDLKIEEVSEEDDFEIIEKDTKKDEEDYEEPVEDLSVPLESEDNKSQLEDIKIEDVEVLEPKDENTMPIEENSTNNALDPVAEEISNLVDNTFVINDATDDFEENNEEETKDKNKLKLSKIEQFDIGEDELSNDEPTDFEVETTTTLKLDEIDEQIKSLRLEDSDNSNFDIDMLNDVKPQKKKKSVSVKGIDEIKKDAQNRSKNQNDDVDIVADLPLPSLDEVAQTEQTVEESDDIWSF